MGWGVGVRQGWEVKEWGKWFNEVNSGRPDWVYLYLLCNRIMYIQMSQSAGGCDAQIGDKVLSCGFLEGCP